MNKLDGKVPPFWGRKRVQDLDPQRLMYFIRTNKNPGGKEWRGALGEKE